MLPPKTVAFISAPSYPFTTHPASQPLFLQSLAQFTARYTTSSTSSFFFLYPPNFHLTPTAPLLDFIAHHPGRDLDTSVTTRLNPVSAFIFPPSLPRSLVRITPHRPTQSSTYLQLHVRKSQFKHTHPNPTQPNHYTCTFSFGNPQGVDNCDNSIENIECPDDWTKKTRFRRE